MKKRLLFVFLIAMIILPIGLNVKASESNKSENVEITVIDKKIPARGFFINPSDVIGNNSRSTSIPTAYWNLSSANYYGNLVEVRASWLYTNYYFYPNSSGKLYLDYYITPINSPGTKMYIAVYDITTSSTVTTYTSAGSPTGSCIQVSGLNTSHKYAFAFKAVRDPWAYNGVQGTITVYH